MYDTRQGMRLARVVVYRSGYRRTYPARCMPTRAVSHRTETRPPSPAGTTGSTGRGIAKMGGNLALQSFVGKIMYDTRQGVRVSPSRRASERIAINI